MNTQSRASIPGLHHVTAICGDPQQNIEFYSGLLGLRLVKKTVNFDDPSSYHLYYGDGVGTPGTIMTFFAWPDLGRRGRRGRGQMTGVSFSVPEGALKYWEERLAAGGVDFSGAYEQFGEELLSFKAPDGLKLELVVESGVESREPWSKSPVPLEYRISRIRGVSSCLMGYEQTASLLVDRLGFRKVLEEGNYLRFAVGQGRGESIFDIRVEPSAQRGRMGVGAIHHVAWRVANREEQDKWRAMLSASGVDVTPVLDRQYFESIYFREPGGILFEIATDLPGFTADEDRSELGMHLKLPPQLEGRRVRLEGKLPEVHVVEGEEDLSGKEASFTERSRRS